jgi:hypothetical protein
MKSSSVFWKALITALWMVGSVFVNAIRFCRRVCDAKSDAFFPPCPSYTPKKETIGLGTWSSNVREGK